MTKHQFIKFKKITPGVVTKISRKKVLIIVIPMIFSLFLQLYVSNRAAGQGQELAKINSQIETAKRDNKILREEIASNASLQKIEVEGLALGLSKPESVEYIQPDAAIGKAADHTAFVGSQ